MSRHSYVAIVTRGEVTPETSSFDLQALRSRGTDFSGIRLHIQPPGKPLTLNRHDAVVVLVHTDADLFPTEDDDA